MDRCTSIRPSLMRRLLDRVGVAQPTRPSTKRRRVVLSMEALEDRLCPAVDYWTGAGAASNNNWSNAANWQNDVAPKAGDILIFGSVSTPNKVANNDYAAGTVFNSIQIEDNGYRLQGNAIDLQAGISSSDGFNYVGMAIALTAAQAFTSTGNGTLDIGGSLNNGGYLLTINSGVDTLTVGSTGDILFTGSSINGSGGLIKDGNGKFILQDSAADTYTGTTTIQQGNIYLDGAQGNAIVGNLVIGTGTGPTQNDVVRLNLSNQIASSVNVSVYSDGLLDLDGFNNAIGSLTMAGGFVDTGSGTLTLDGNVTTLACSSTAVINGNLALGSAGRTFTVASDGGTDLDVAATITGGSGAELIKAGAGTMRLWADNTYSGQTVVSTGTLTAAGADVFGTGSVTVDSGATLEYTNTMPSGPLGFTTLTIGGSLTNNGTVVLDGLATLDTLAIGGSFTQGSGGTLEMRAASTSAYDQVVVAGAASLAGTLDVNPQDGFQPTGGNQFKLMSFKSYSGSFGTVSLPHPNVMELNYAKQSLTMVDTATVTGPTAPTPPAGAYVWTGAGSNDNWTNAANWAGGAAPTTGATLWFAASPTSLVSNNNFAAGTEFASITIAGSGYKITGNAVTVEDGLTAVNSTGTNTVDLPITLAAAETIGDVNAGATLVLGGAVNNGGHLLTVNAGGNVLYTGSAITGSGGLYVEGNGTFTLASTSASTFTGATEVSSGTLLVDNAGALSSATTVDAGATLQLAGGLTFASTQNLTLNGFGVNYGGALQEIGGIDTWNGSIDLASNTSIAAGAGATLTINGVISGQNTCNVSYVGTGTVILAGDNSNAGFTTVAAGILALDNANALTAAPIYGGRGTEVDSGATLQLRAGVQYALDPLDLNGCGVGGIGALEKLTGNNLWQGPIDLHSAATIGCAAGAGLSISAGITNEGYQLTVNNNGSVDFAGIVCGSAGLIQNGTGNLTLSNPAPELYAGATIINSGSLTLSKSPNIAALVGAGITVEAGATLTGTGIIDTSVTNYGVVAPGGQGSTGSLTINGNYTQEASGTLDIQLASVKALDQLMISGLATLGGTLDVSLLAGFEPATNNQFQVMTFGSSSGKFSTVVLPALSNGDVLSDAYDPMDLIITALAATKS